jgi:hypothetical protein
MSEKTISLVEVKGYVKLVNLVNEVFEKKQRSIDLARFLYDKEFELVTDDASQLEIDVNKSLEVYATSGKIYGIKASFKNKELRPLTPPINIEASHEKTVIHMPISSDEYIIVAKEYIPITIRYNP